MITSDNFDGLVNGERFDRVAAGTGSAARKARYAARRATGPISACPEGHPYTEANTYLTAGRKRMCLACHAALRIHSDVPAGGRLDVSGVPVMDLRPYLKAQESGRTGHEIDPVAPVLMRAVKTSQIAPQRLPEPKEGDTRLTLF